MKSRNINIIIILSVVCALCLFYFKFHRQTDDIDRFENGLKGMRSYISPQTTIGLKLSPPNSQLATSIAYVLAPASLYYDVRDTTLFLLQPNTTDTATLLLLRKKTVIWQNRDDQYQYILARTP